MDSSQNFPLVIPQGATYIRTIEYLDSDEEAINLTGYTALMQFRNTVESEGDPIIELSTSDGTITITALTGLITISIPASTTEALDNALEMVYDLFIYSPTNIATRLLAGNATVSGSVTR